MNITKTLTLKQPWASLVALGIKDIENRTWSTSYRGRILIHAGQGIDRQSDWIIPGEEYPKGLIIGSVDLVDIVTDSKSVWAEENNFHWVLENAIYFDCPIPATGKLGLWNFQSPELALQQPHFNLAD